MYAIFLSSFSNAIRQARITAIVYFVQLCLALTLGIQVYDVLKASIGHSLEINKLLVHYDHTVITDFLKVHGASITPLIGQLRWLMFVWLIFSVFINAGLLYCAITFAKQERASARAFWQAGADYFFPFLKICLVFLLVALIWSGIIFIPIALYFEPSIEYFPSEVYTVWSVLFLLFLYLFGLMILFIWSVNSRIYKIRTGARIVASLKNGWKIFWKQKGRFIALMLGFVGILILLFAVSFLLDNWIGMHSTTGVLLLFVLKQAFVFFRIQIRQMMYAGMGKLG